MNNKKIIKILVVVLTISTILSVGGYFGYHYLSNYVDFLSSNKETIKLKETEVTTSIKEGIYITDVSEIVENVMPSIVSITSKKLISSGYYGPFRSENSYSSGAGSGIIISQTDDYVYILTNYHVIEGASELSVKFIDDKEVDASVVGYDENKDVAVIKVSINNISSDTMNSIRLATIGSSDELKVGNGIIAIGNALGYGQSVTTGVVSALNREVTIDNVTNKMIQIDAAINGGNSGGALLNSKGEVVGINSAKYSSSSLTEASVEGMGFAIPISDVKDLIEDLLNGKKNEDIKLGIEGYMTTSNNLIGYNLPEGFYISSITSGGYADNSELEIGNIITQINNKDVTSVEVISSVLKTLKGGDVVTLKVKYIDNRSYKEKTIKIKIN